MDTRYLRVLDKIRYVKEAADDAVNHGPYKTFEDKKAIKALEHLIEHLEDAESILERFSKPAKEGVLVEQSDEKFHVEYNDGGESYPLSCGSSLEVYFNREDWDNDIDDVGWYSGRVEFKDGHYYFYGPGGNQMLYTGMKVRMRVDE